MTSLSDLKTLYHLTLKPVRGKTHAERIESFYSGQSQDYDRFRERLLPGRKELFYYLEGSPENVWVDFGCGTGSSLEFMEKPAAFKKIYLVDVSSSLLALAKERTKKLRLDNTHTIHSEASAFKPPHKVDLVTFSFSLTMMPDWLAVLEQAHRILKPGGRIAVVDFYVSRKQDQASGPTHSWWTRHFWPLWFQWDSVFLNPDHLVYLKQRFSTEWLFEGQARLPYLPVGKAPYYCFVGEKRAHSK